MRFLVELWVPILVSGAAVFVLSALAWTVGPHHRTEYVGVPNETDVMDALRAARVPPGRYVVPFLGDGERFKTPEGRTLVADGPLAFITIAPKGLPRMGRMMALSLASALLISACAAYLAFHTLAPGAPYLTVFRVTGMATFMAYALGLISESVWFARPWRSLAVNTLDAVIYAMVSGGIFGWLWAR